MPARPTSAKDSAALFLGIEGGATSTTACLANSAGKIIQQTTFGPANARLLTDLQLKQLLRQIHRSFDMPSALAIGMAGARTDRDRQRLGKHASHLWPRIPIYATNDLETALFADDQSGDETARVLLLSGTGSCCYGQDPAGRSVKVGGWGHLLGDKGSAYEIGLRALKATLYHFDRDGKWPALGVRLLNALSLNTPDDLIAWSQAATKSDIASLAIQVFRSHGDPIASDILEGAKASLAEDAIACARRLAPPGAPIRIIFSGSVLLRNSHFSKMVELEIKQHWPSADIAPLQRPAVFGAVRLAALKSKLPYAHLVATPPAAHERSNLSFTRPEFLAQSPTEQRNPVSFNLDRLPTEAAVALVLKEDGKVPKAILRERKNIARAIRLIAKAFQNGGRLFYAGAGTSGRLGILDASECPPTFRTSPEMVQGIMAGGQTALWKAVEGAEDDFIGGEEAIRFRNVTRKDVVVGIAASGRTPFVWGALGEARNRGARTILVCFNPALPLPKSIRPDLVVAPSIGPEILTGSTRLKAGTATKLILNLFTTLAMVKIGKVKSNLMIDLNPSNVKLRDRAIRIVRDLTGANLASAQRALEQAGWVIKDACRKLRR